MCVADSQLLLAIVMITAHLITSDDHASRQEKQEAYHYFGLHTGMSDCFKHKIYEDEVMQLS